MVKSITSTQDKAFVAEAEAVVALAAGRLDAAFDNGMLAAAEDPSGSSAFLGLLTAGRAAMWLGEPQRVAVAVEQLTEAHVHGAWLDAVRLGLEAGLAVLEGRTEEGVTLFAEATKSLRDLDVPF